MKLGLIAAVALLVCGCGSKTAGPKKPMADKYVIVAAGESNSGGRALNSDATAGELAARSQVQMWVPNGTDAFQDLDVGTNCNVDHDGLTPGSEHGWELQLANDVESGIWSTIQDPVYYIQTGQGGSKIADWEVSDPYWVEWLDRIDKAKAYFASQSITPKWIVFLSLGINDAIAGTSTATYKSGLIAWIDRIKTELPGCKIVLTELTPTYTTYTTRVREIADSEADVAFAYTQDLGLKDTNHWSYAGMKTLSTRMSRMAQIMWGEADGRIFSNYTSTMYPNGLSFGWSASSPTNSGAISKDAIQLNDGAYVAWLTPSSGVSDAIVVAIESTKDTTHTWLPGGTFLYGAYRFSNTVYGGVNYSGAQNSHGAASDELRILRSGDNALLQKRATAGEWSTVHTSTGAFTGVTTAYVHIINAVAGTSDVLTLSFPASSLAITSPAANDIALVGTATDITWTSLSVDGNVDILYSSDGSNWSPIVSGTANDGSYSWTPEASQLSATAYIRVRSSDDNDVYDDSSVFKVATTTPSSGGGGLSTITISGSGLTIQVA